MRSTLLFVAILLFLAGGLGVMLSMMKRMPGTNPIAGPISWVLLAGGMLLYVIVLYAVEPPPRGTLELLLQTPV